MSPARTPVRLVAYAVGVAMVFGAAFAVGAAADPIASSNTSAHEGHAGHGADDPAALPGLAVTSDGYTFVPAAATLPVAKDATFRFTVTGPDGRPVAAYQKTHEKDLHLIVVRRDLTGFQHLHPTRAADGTWSVSLRLDAAGSYRFFAGFQPAALDQPVTLGTDIAVAGSFVPAPLPAPAATASVDGYDVALHGAPVAGQESELTFTVSRGGIKVTDLQPYLGAFGHLVSLRTGDLAYLHTHPATDAAPGQRGGPVVSFATTFPTASTYRLFLDFQAAGKVHTAAFTVTVPSADGKGGPS